MSHLDWSKIGNGATFESMLGAILRHEDPNIEVFDRPGKDSGMDARSSDGKKVFQAKFISDLKFSKAIDEAKKEIEKIIKYKDATHPNFSLWKDVKEWCLITNAEINPKDKEKWENEVEAIFKKNGFQKANFIHGQELVEKIIALPSIKDEYFEGESRVLLSLAEGKEKVCNDPIALKGLQIKVKGRDTEFNLFQEFLKNNDKKVLPVIGAGGVGKTRFSLECGYLASDAGWDIYWANPASMESSSKWFRSIVPGRKTLLIIDEPESEKTLRILFEQISSAKLKDWKVLISVRSYNDSSVLELKNKRINFIANEILLNNLASDSSKMIIKNFLHETEKLKTLSNDEIEEWTQKVHRTSGGFPAWISLAILILESGLSISELATDSEGLAAQYVDEIVNKFSSKVLPESKKIKIFIEIIALLQPVNTESDEDVLNLLKELVGIEPYEVQIVFDELIKKSFLFKKGRLAEIKPDVIRDYLIFNEVGSNKGKVNFFIDKVISKKNSRLIKRVITQVARIDFKSRFDGEKKVFLDMLWIQFFEICTRGLAEQYNIFSFASEISFSNPSYFFKVCDIIKSHSFKDVTYQDELWGNVTLTHTDLLLKFSWELFTACRYATADEDMSKGFNELIEMAIFEEKELRGEKSYLKNDGKRAIQLIIRLMSGQKEQFHEYEPLIFNWLKDKLSNLDSVDNSTLVVLLEIAKAISSTEREDILSKGNSIVFYRIFVAPNSKSQENRLELKRLVWNAIKTIKDIEKRKSLWIILRELYRQSNEASDPWNRKEDRSTVNYWENELANELNSLKNYIQNTDIPVEEIESIRSIWEWALKHDEREKINNLALECDELIVLKNEMEDFKSLFDYDRALDRDELIRSIVIKLNSAEEIKSFVEDAVKFADRGRLWYGIGGVASRLALEYKEGSEVYKYVNNVLSGREDSPYLDFACSIFVNHISSIRKTEAVGYGDDVLKKWREFKTDDLKNTFLHHYMRMPHPESCGLMTFEDYSVLENIISLGGLPRDSLFTLGYFTGYVSNLDLNKAIKLSDQLFAMIDDISFNCDLYRQIIDGVWYRSIFDTKGHKVIYPDGYFSWLVNLMSFVPNVDELSTLFETELIEIKKKTQHSFSIGDFATFLKKRIEISEQITEDIKWKLITARSVMSRIVDKLSPDKIDIDKVRSDFNELLSLNNHKSLLGYLLPEIATGLDPQGLVLPDLILEKLKEGKFQWISKEEIKETFKYGYEWYRYAGYYPTNSKQWRKIAIVACSLTSLASEEVKFGTFFSLTDRHIQTWWGGVDEIHPRFIRAVEKAEQDLENEKEQVLIPFMRWRLDSVKKDLERQRLRLVEEKDGYND